MTLRPVPSGGRVGKRLGATKKAKITENEVMASVPQSKVPGLQSAGIQVQGTAEDNEIRENRIKGRGSRFQ